MMNGLPLHIEGRADVYEPNPVPGFYLRYQGKQVFCLLLPAFPVDLPAPGSGVRVGGQWSNAVKGVFEVHGIEAR